jgi:protein SCO1/2
MGGDAWGASYFPNIALTRHDGVQQRFFDDLILNKVVVINFMYTTCKDACPMETARLLDVQRLLGDRLGKDVFMYSISIDPANDTAEVLAAYREKWGAKKGWNFYTGSKEEIDGLRKKLGVYSPEMDPSNKLSEHNLNLVVGNQRTGRWMKRSPFENPYVIATQVGTWLTNWSLPPEEQRPYDQAPELRQMGPGEDLFRTRCSSCHQIGGGDTWADGTQRVGPDLYNVTRVRDPAWLRRWLSEPDRMLEEGDPIATAMLRQYRGIAMPNLRLTAVDVENLIRFLDEESARIDAQLDRRLQVGSSPAPAASSAPAAPTATPPSNP